MCMTSTAVQGTYIVRLPRSNCGPGLLRLNVNKPHRNAFQAFAVPHTEKQNCTDLLHEGHRRARGILWYYGRGESRTLYLTRHSTPCHILEGHSRQFDTICTI